MKSSIFSTISDDVSNIAPRNFQQYLIWKYCTTRRRNYRFRNICFSLHGLALPWLLISFTVECLDLPLFFEAVLWTHLASEKHVALKRAILQYIIKVNACFHYQLNCSISNFHCIRASRKHSMYNKIHFKEMSLKAFWKRHL